MISRRNLLAGLGLAALPNALPAIGAPAKARRVFRAPVTIEGGRLLVAVGFNGQGPYIFMIDTGGVVSLIRDDLARALKLPIVGHSRLGGIGARDIYPNYDVRDFVIGGTMRQRDVLLVGGGDLQFGDDVRGTLAAGILTGSDSEIDFDAGEFRLYPDGRGDWPGFTEVDSRISHTGGGNGGSAYVFARAAVDGQSYDFLLDTGAPHPITLFDQAARGKGYWDDARPYAPVRPHGIGGEGPMGRLIRADSFAFGGVTDDRPLIRLEGRGRDRSMFGDGILGLPMIRRFNLSIDVGSRALWVQPNRQPVVRDRAPLSGIWVGQHGDAIVIEAVGTGSPGADAGLRTGDRIVGETFDGLVRKLGGPPGPLTLSIARDGAPQRRTLTLAPWL